MQTITILTHGGQIQDIQGIPEDIRVEVKDYDEEVTPPSPYEDGHDYIASY